MTDRVERGGSPLPGTDCGWVASGRGRIPPRSHASAASGMLRFEAFSRGCWSGSGTGRDLRRARSGIDWGMGMKPKKKLLISVAVLLLLAGILTVVWMICDWPPPRLILTFGIPPFCAPTGQSIIVEGVEFVEIGPGVFQMGSTYGAGGDFLGRISGAVGLPWGNPPGSTDEMPLRWVEFRRGFWIARTELTNAQYERFNPDHQRSEFSPGNGHPVVDVSWEDARRYCSWLSGKSGLPVRLPSAAEWECACRGGSRREFCFGSDQAKLADHAWYGRRWDAGAQNVARLRPNAWGLFDLHGNVWELCEDTFQESYKGAPIDGSAWTEDTFQESYEGAPNDGSAWTASGEVSGNGPSDRINRGGGWSDSARRCRSAFRATSNPTSRFLDLGFRPAFSPSDS